MGQSGVGSVLGGTDERRWERVFDQADSRDRRARLSTWQAREGRTVWQKAVFEKAHRLVRLHEAIEAVQMPGDTTILIRVLGIELAGDRGGFREVLVERGHLLALLKQEENDIMQDMARILRQVTEP